MVIITGVISFSINLSIIHIKKRIIIYYNSLYNYNYLLIIIPLAISGLVLDSILSPLVLLFSQVNNMSALPEEEPMAEYPLKTAGSRSHLDDSITYVKPPNNYNPE